MILLLLTSLTFIKSFPGSMPEYYRIVLQENGDAAFAEEPDDPREIKFHVSPEFAKQAFDLSSKLDNFKGEPLESHRKVAFMGKKTLLYQKGDERHEAAFNYSERPEAMDLAALFERLATTQLSVIELQRLMRFDKLGLMKQLLQVEIAFDHKDLAEPELLMPVLEQISTSKSYMEIARARARVILGKIESPDKH